MTTSFPKNKIKILLLENVSQKAVNLFKEQQFNLECIPNISPEELKDKIKDVHAIGVRSKTKLNKDILYYAKKLLCIGCFCIGTDQTDLSTATTLGVPVFNSPYANTRSVAELVIGEMICLARKLFDKSQECHDGIWNKNSENCVEIRGKTLGIVGYGHVGSQLSVLAESLGMKVYYYDIAPVMPLGNAKKVGSLEELLPLCNFVSLHVPKTHKTINMIGYAQIRLMKKGSYLINASRGDVVVVRDVANALKSNYLAGASFDVFPNEPSNSEEFVSELQGCNNTILTPHIGGSTEEAQDSIGIEVASKMINFINEGSTIGSVNFPEIELKNRQKTHKILHIHNNMPGVMMYISSILSDYNILSQVLGTNEKIGYLIIELDKAVSEKIKNILSEFNYSIKVRILY